MSKESKGPYIQLGKLLRRLREQSRETVSDVSGAVEIDEVALEQYENGTTRPSEDILLLLISHFGIEEDRAAELWLLAGYENKFAAETDEDNGHQREDRVHHSSFDKKQTTMMIMLDPRVMYTDGAEVFANDSGVILNFNQTSSNKTPPLTVSRIGMSRDQAKSLMGTLHQVLYELENPNRKRLEGGDKPRKK